MNYKEITLVSVLLFSLAYLLPASYFSILSLIISSFLLYQTYHDSKEEGNEYKKWVSLSLLIFFTITSVFVFYNPALAGVTTLFYVLQIFIYSLKIDITQKISEWKIFRELKIKIEESTKTTIQSEISEQLKEINKKEGIATEKEMTYRKKVDDLKRELFIQSNERNKQIEKLSQEKEKYQKFADEARENRLLAQEENYKLHWDLEQKIEDSVSKERQVKANIEAYKQKAANIERKLITQNDKSENELKRLSQEKEKYQKLSEKAQEQIFQNQEETKRLRQEMKREIAENAAREKEIQNYIAKNDQLLSNKDQEIKNEKERSEKQRKEFEEEIRISQELAVFSEEEKLKVQQENRELKEQLNRSEFERDKASKIANQKNKRSTERLEERWRDAYPELEFENGVIKDVTKNFEDNDFGHIENQLKNLSTSYEPRKMKNNRGKMVVSGEHHIKFSIRSYHQCRIFFLPLKGNSTGKKVLITQIIKHNDPRYGK